MAIVSAGKGSKSALGSMKYVVFEKKSSNKRAKLVAGINCSANYKDAANDFKQILNIYKNRGHREAHHMVLSFSENESAQFSKKELMQKAMEITKHTFPNHQVWLGLHDDTDHTHVHLIINAVDLETGKKLQIAGRKGMHDIMNKVQEKAKELNLDDNMIVGKQKQRNRGDIHTRNPVEKKLLESNNSWKKNLVLAVIDSLEQSNSLNSFIMNCSNNGVGCQWSTKRQNVTFYLLSSPSKKARASNLSKTFTLPELKSKDSILHHLNINYTKQIETQIKSLPVREMEKKHPKIIITKSKGDLSL
ncbi:relaxase/mobilization nuclease domain-containing protein [Veillonella criceti]|uniref:Relaxase/Mobilisation nuclease domain n=1 Tax=Veillonella criceti TaxID=103891 RepID=A0A380NK04_9FIRM|nr:relaxase/mobilization nuclease domain-containing protein [Veillonella criceti]SUP42829.1 Relaxase/Mobilisation nuclease domain [Veillonella criceti]